MERARRRRGAPHASGYAIDIVGNWSRLAPGRRGRLIAWSRGGPRYANRPDLRIVPTASCAPAGGPEPPYSPTPPTVDLAPVLERLAALEAKIEAQGATLRADVAQMRAQIQTLPGAGRRDYVSADRLSGAALFRQYEAVRRCARARLPGTQMTVEELAPGDCLLSEAVQRVELRDRGIKTWNKVSHCEAYIGDGYQRGVARRPRRGAVPVAARWACEGSRRTRRSASARPWRGSRRSMVRATTGSASPIFALGRRSRREEQQAVLLRIPDPLVPGRRVRSVQPQRRRQRSAGDVPIQRVLRCL